MFCLGVLPFCLPLIVFSIDEKYHYVNRQFSHKKIPSMTGLKVLGGFKEIKVMAVTLITEIQDCIR
jgi:hypothetical protein